MRLHRAIGFPVLIAISLLAAGLRAEISAGDLSALGDAEYDKRHAATKKLLADVKITRGDIAAAYRQATSAEQKQRLLTIGRHHVLRLMRQEKDAESRLGALGLRHEPVNAEDLPDVKQPAVRVRRTLPGFPAHAVLEAGDLILAVDGNFFQPNITNEQISTQFGDWIQRVVPGKTTKLTIMRGGKQIEAQTVVASLDALRMMFDVHGGVQQSYNNEWLRFQRTLEPETAKEE